MPYADHAAAAQRLTEAAVSRGLAIARAKRILTPETPLHPLCEELLRQFRDGLAAHSEPAQWLALGAENLWAIQDRKERGRATAAEWPDDLSAFHVQITIGMLDQAAQALG